MNIPESTNLTGRRVKLEGKHGWGSVTQDTGGYIKVQFGMVTGAWHAKASVVEVDPPILPAAGAAA